MSTAPLQPLPRHTPVGATMLSALAASVIGLVVALALALSLLDLAHAQYFAVESDSMAPTFVRGDLVITRAVSQLRVGDAVTFRKYGRLVTHRIVAVGRAAGTYETRGDGNVAADPWTITAADVVGRVDNVIRRAGYPLLFLESALGRVLAANAVLGLLALLWWAMPRAIRVPSRLLHPAYGYAV